EVDSQASAIEYNRVYGDLVEFSNSTYVLEANEVGDFDLAVYNLVAELTDSSGNAFLLDYGDVSYHEETLIVHSSNNAVVDFDLGGKSSLGYMTEEDSFDRVVYSEYGEELSLAETEEYGELFNADTSSVSFFSSGYERIIEAMSFEVGTTD